MRMLLAIPMLILAGLAVFFFTPKPAAPQQYSFESGATPVLQAAQAFLLPLSNPAYAPVRDTAIPRPHIDANASLVLHVESGRMLYEKNTTQQVPIASLTKLLSALVVVDLFDPSEVVTIASGSVRVDGQKQTLYLGERILVRDLMSMMLVESSNDAAYALASYARERGLDFVAVMNRKANELGMYDCTFTGPAGLDDNAYCTARDLLRLVQSALQTAPQLWPIMAQPQLTIYSADGNIVHEVRSTDELLGEIPGVLGGKTGYTDGALGCLILVVKLPEKDDTLISIVLGSRSRFADTKSLLSWSQLAYRWQ